MSSDPRPGPATRAVHDGHLDHRFGAVYRARLPQLDVPLPDARRDAPAFQAAPPARWSTRATRTRRLPPSRRSWPRPRRPRRPSPFLGHGRDHLRPARAAPSRRPHPPPARGLRRHPPVPAHLGPAPGLDGGLVLGRRRRVARAGPGTTPRRSSTPRRRPIRSCAASPLARLAREAHAARRRARRRQHVRHRPPPTRSRSTSATCGR